MVELQRRIVTHPKPVVTRLAGPVRAGGLGIVAASDVVICGDDVTFAFTESRLGARARGDLADGAAAADQPGGRRHLPHRAHVRRRGGRSDGPGHARRTRG